jgi:hypothetical protein
MSFGIYINSRLETEGWDLQLEFQRFAGERGMRKARRTVQPAVLALLLFLPGLLPGFPSGVPLYAEQEAESSEQDVLTVLDKVLSSSEFGNEKDTWTIQFKKGQKQNMRRNFFLRQLSGVRNVFGLIIRTLVFAAIAAALGFGVYHYIKTGAAVRKDRGWTGRSVAAPGPEKSSALLLDEARSFWDQGRIREAWARCFAAVLAAFSERDGLSFPKDATEYSCLRLLKQNNTPELSAFSAFLHSWIDLAYGGRELSPEKFEEALAFCASIQEAGRG